jgi:hypothetical protein
MKSDTPSTRRSVIAVLDIKWARGVRVVDNIEPPRNIGPIFITDIERLACAGIARNATNSIVDALNKTTSRPAVAGNIGGQRGSRGFGAALGRNPLA